MAEAVVNVVVEQLVSAAADWLQQEISLIKGVKSKLKNMEKKMQIIQTVLEDAENQSVKKKIVKLWLEELQDVSYDMDDVLDEWSTRVQILERDEAEENNTSNEIVGPSSSSPPTTCFSLKKLNCFTSVKQLPWHREIALRIKDINERMNSVFSEMKEFELATKVVGNDGLDKIIDIARITTSSVDESKVYGRVDDKEFLLRKVLAMDTEKEKGLQVVSIVGAGGLGKTTLAQMIYNDQKVKEKFKKNRIWVCVSKPFNEVKVARAILEGLQVDHTKMNNLQTLHQSIESSLNEVKFLLVLDDVWDEDSEKWERLSLRLKVGDPNSKILVTTRKEEVVRTMGTTPANILRPRLISDSDCWLLMKQRALQERPNRRNDELEEIGKEIAKKCKGLPLAAKTLGGLLRSKDYIQKWKEVLKSEIWKLEKVEINLFPHIFLSYQELPSVLKRCLLILALFPKDTQLDAEKVIYHWMTYGYLNPKIEQVDMLKTGQKYLKFLISRAFLEEKSRISMHDIMHDFALYLLGDELLSIMVDDSESTSKIAPKSTKARHLIINGNINPTPIDLDFGKLRTCILLKVPPNVTSDLVRRLKMIRKLNLKRCDLKQIPESIGDLIHLRMLDLSYNPLVELPETIGNLFNLQHLFLERISLSSLPQSLGKLVNLISLTPSDAAVKKAPESVEKLINLHSLDILHIEAGKSYLGFLKDLNQLRGLAIAFQRDYEDEDDAKKAAIGRKKHLTGLELYFNDYNVTDGVVAALQPNPNIQFLCISGLLPSWITFLHHLKDLQVWKVDVSTLPPLGQLESLETIIIWECNSLKIIGREFLLPNKKFCAFPKLVELKFYDCRGLTRFEDLKPEEEGEITVMPNLQILKFHGCDKLVEIPFRLLRRASSLKKLYIQQQRLLDSKCKIDLDVEVTDDGVAGDVCLYHGRDGTLKMRVKSSKKVPITAITHIYFTFFQLWSPAELSSIWSLPPMGKLPYLESLTINGFHSLKFIGREFLGIDNEEFVAFPNLVSLEISMCDLLEGWEDLKPEDEGKIIVMPELEKFKITRCRKFQVIPFRLLRQASSLKELYIQTLNSLFGLSVDVIDEDVAGGVRLSRRLGEKLEMSVKSCRKVPITIITHSYITLIDLYFQAETISYLPPMGKLPYLESLTIKWFKSLKFIGREFLGIDNEEFVAFPNLVSLKISECDLLEGWEDLKWEDEGKIIVMPKLENLKITRCPKFQVMPPRLFSQLLSLNVIHLPRDDQPFGEYNGERQTDDGPDHTIFVGDLAADVTDYVLQETFKAVYQSVKGAKVVTDKITGCSKGYGFVRFANEHDQIRAITEMNSVFCSTRPMRIGPASNKKPVATPKEHHPH